MDASQYKDYVLFMLFIKYISDKYGKSRDFAPPVTIPAGASFEDMVALKGKGDIGDKINTQIIQPLIEANTRLARSDFPDFNDPNKLGEGKAMVDRLTNLIGIFQKPELDFSQNRADHDDILGDAYEYLMRHFATESGKSKGQFYTPAEVSRVIARVIGISPENTKASTTAYDPTCGSGSLLLKVAAQAGKHITLEGQEKDVTTAGLARMNMILHDFPTASILSGNTLAEPKFKDGERLRTYDYVVANPPFSDKAWATGLTPSADPFQRFAWGEPPAKQGDYAYLLHIIRSMKSAGKAACILPHGVLFRGNAEGTIRRQLVGSGYLKGIIGLPANLFYGTGIPACIVVLDKEHAAGRKGVFMIDASKDFIKDGSKNRLREQDIHRIVDTFTWQIDVPRYARMVPLAEIADSKNDFNLNLPRYIDSTEPEDLQDIDAHLRGGIPVRDLDALEEYWQVLPGVRAALFAEVIDDRPALPADMHAAYAETHFFCPNQVGDWPDTFAIVSGYATTGERWTDEQNLAADAALEAELRQRGDWLQRITGYSPATGHAEPGWAVPLALDAACDLGARFKQDAIYTVREGVLSVSFCDARRAAIEIGTFFARLHVSDAWPLVRPGYAALRLPLAEVKRSILAHAEFAAFQARSLKRFTDWREATTPRLLAFDADDHPKSLIETIAEELLTAFEPAPLLDAYDLYQHLMDYWAETMQDDAYLIAADGWVAGAQPREIVRVKDKNNRMAWPEPHDYLRGKRRFKSDLVPAPILVDRYCVAERDAIEALDNRLATLEQQLDEMREENSNEEGLLAEVIEGEGDKQRIAAKAVKARLKEIGKDPDYADERAALRAYADLLDEQTKTRAERKAAEVDLDERIDAKYSVLTEAEIKTLVVEDKWMARLSGAVQGELDRVSQTLTGRVRELAERYAEPLPQLVDEVAVLAARVEGHLEKMRASWR
jgi:type I restriction system adenine methylase HsdM